MGLTQRMCSRQHAQAMWVSFIFLLSLLLSFSSAVLRHQQGLRAPPPSSGQAPPDPLWFQQRLDHFRPSEHVPGEGRRPLRSEGGEKSDWRADQLLGVARLDLPPNINLSTLDVMSIIYFSSDVKD